MSRTSVSRHAGPGRTWRRLSRVPLVAVVLFGLIATAGAAVAYWGGAGAGAGSADTSSSLNVTATAATASANVVPGGQGDVKLVLSNPNPHPVTVPTLELDTSQGDAGFAVDAGHSSCALSALGFTTQDGGGPGYTVPAQVDGVDGTLDVALTGALSMSSDALNACQGATFTVYVRAGS